MTLLVGAGHFLHPEYCLIRDRMVKRLIPFVVYNAAENYKPYPEHSGVNVDIVIKEQTE